MVAARWWMCALLVSGCLKQAGPTGHEVAAEAESISKASAASVWIPEGEDLNDPDNHAIIMFVRTFAERPATEFEEAVRTPVPLRQDFTGFADELGYVTLPATDEVLRLSVPIAQVHEIVEEGDHDRTRYVEWVLRNRHSSAIVHLWMEMQVNETVAGRSPWGEAFTRYAL